MCCEEQAKRCSFKVMLRSRLSNVRVSFIASCSRVPWFIVGLLHSVMRNIANATSVSNSGRCLLNQSRLAIHQVHPPKQFPLLGPLSSEIPLILLVAIKALLIPPIHTRQPPTHPPPTPIHTTSIQLRHQSIDLTQRHISCHPQKFSC